MLRAIMCFAVLHSRRRYRRRSEPMDPIVVGCVISFVIGFVGAMFVIANLNTTPPGHFPQGVPAPNGWVQDSAGKLSAGPAPGVHLVASSPSVTPHQTIINGLILIGIAALLAVAMACWGLHGHKAAQRPTPPSPTPPEPWRARQVGADVRFLPLPEPLEPLNPRTYHSDRR